MKRFHTIAIVIGSVFFLNASAHADFVLPLEGLGKFKRFGMDARYQIGDEWGKKAISPEAFEKESAVFKRMAKATGRFGGGTAFYIGKFNGAHVMATNHHVQPYDSCAASGVIFPLLNNKMFRCDKVLGTWTDIDLAFFTIKVPAESEELMAAVAKNFNFHADIYPDQKLLTIGFGVGNNPMRQEVANQDNDCRVFSEKNEFRFMADPDRMNPAEYKAWSFANGCDVSHGDSGSAMMDRETGEIVGIIWTGGIPKEKETQNSNHLLDIQKTHSEEIWKQLSYSVPAIKMGEYLNKLLENSENSLDEFTQATLRALLQE